jgi:hypothetical protein
MYKHNFQARSRNLCRRGKGTSMTQVECVCVCVFFLFLPYLSSMQSACAVLYCHLLSVWPYRIFPHYLMKATISGQNLLNIKYIILVYNSN